LGEMRPTTDLLHLDWVFVWQTPLTTTEFLQACQHRGVRFFDWPELEAFHKARALTPWLRFEARDESRAVGELDFSRYLHGDEGVGMPHDPRMETFHFWSSYIHQHEYGQAWTSRFLYSPYQLLLLPDLSSLRAHIRGQRTTESAYALDRRFQLKLPEQKQSVIIGEAVENDEVGFLLSTIETKYLPHIYDRLTLHRDGKIESWLQTCRSIDPVVLLNRANLESETIKKTAERLLWRAQSIDPLGEWVDLVRLCHSEKWKTLRGDALIAMDHRIAAEILLLFLEDLVKLELTEPLEQAPKYWRGKYHGRLKPADADLESVLMDFGISPQPSLVLVLEGDTEKLIVPRVMKQLGIPSQTGFIELFKGGGVNQHYALLASYVSTPKLGEAVRSGLLLRRPPTRFLIAFDPESSFATPEKCEGRRRSCVNNICDAIPKEYRTEKLREDIDSLVYIQTWNDRLESFEFAHFTDGELAEALLAAYQGEERHSLLDLAERIGNMRVKEQAQTVPEMVQRPGNIEHIWKGWTGTHRQLPSKIKLAEALWPALEAKIENAISDDKLKEIPVARVLIHAVELAQALPRRSVMLRI
jgi:hypothetical protein